MTKKKIKKATTIKPKKVTTKKASKITTKKAKKVAIKKPKKVIKKKTKVTGDQFKLLTKTMNDIASSLGEEISYNEFFNRKGISELLRRVWWGELGSEGLFEQVPDCDIATTNIVDVKLQYYVEDLDPAWDDSYYAIHYTNVEISFVILVLGKVVFQVVIDEIVELTRKKDKDMDRFDKEFIEALAILNDKLSKIDISKLKKGVDKIIAAEEVVLTLFE